MLGPGDDAWSLPGGVLRIGVSTRFAGTDSRFSLSGDRQRLGTPFSGPLGSTQLPGLQFLETAIGQASGVSAFRISLGTTRADLRRSTGVIPLELSLGLTSRLTARVTAPFFSGVHEINWLLDGTGATVGANPALLAAGPLPLNAAIISGLDTAAVTLERLLDGCILDPLFDPRCAQVTAEQAMIRALLNDSRGLTNALASTYGGRTGVDPGLLVPLTTEAAHLAILQRIATLRAGYERYATPSVADGAGPVGAGAPPTIAQLRAILTDSAYGYALEPISRSYHQGFGDIDASVMLLVFDGIRDTTSWTRFGTMSFGIRQAVGATFRFGTGKRADPDDPLQLATGDGQNDLELTSATDIAFGRHFWSSFIARWTTQQPVDAITRIPDGTGSPFLSLNRRRNTHHELGDRLELTAAPRWVANDYLGVGAYWRWTHEDGERMTEIAPFTDGIPLTFEGPALSAQEVGIGFTWSSVAAWRRGNARWPIEIQWDRSVVVAGENVPRFTADRVAVRVYARLWGR